MFQKIAYINKSYYVIDDQLEPQLCQIYTASASYNLNFNLDVIKIYRNYDLINNFIALYKYWYIDTYSDMQIYKRIISDLNNIKCMDFHIKYGLEKEFDFILQTMETYIIFS